MHVYLNTVMLSHVRMVICTASCSAMCAWSYVPRQAQPCAHGHMYRVMLSHVRMVICQSQSEKFLLRKKIYIEHQNILTAIYDQD